MQGPAHQVRHANRLPIRQLVRSSVSDERTSSNEIRWSVDLLDQISALTLRVSYQFQKKRLNISLPISICDSQLSSCQIEIARRLLRSSGRCISKWK